MSVLKQVLIQHAHYDDGDVVVTTALIGRADQPFGSRMWIGAGAQDGFDPRITHHRPEPIRAQQQAVFWLEDHVKRIHLAITLSAQTAIELAAPRV